MKQIQLMVVLLISIVISSCSSGGGGGGTIDAGTTDTVGGTIDKMLPTVVSTTPANNATGVAVSSIFSATFSERMDPAFFNSANFYINGVTATMSSKCSSAFLYPTSDLSSSTCYTATIANVKDSAGNAIATPYVGTFCTGLSGAVPILPQVIATSANHTIALQSNGTLLAWGGNDSGQLGDGTTTDRTTPVQIGTATNWSAIAAGTMHTIAIKSDGTLWAWGGNSSGQLGDGTLTSRNTPTQIGNATNWSAIAAGGYHSIALKSDGTLWAWGENASGQLGDGATTNRTTPVQIGTATNWSAIAAGTMHTIAIKSDGTLWAWGDNNVYQLGGSTSSYYTDTPAQIGTDTNWGAIAAGAYHTLALKSVGTLWAWGKSIPGRLANGNLVSPVSHPTQIGAAANWSKIAGGTDHAIALKSDGTLWAWGENASGQLGDGTTTSKDSPTKLGTATNWSAIAASADHTLALKSDGTLWAWGENASGQLGDGFTTNRTAPVQINLSPSTTAPSAPFGVTATAGNAQIIVTWSNTSGATSYDIYSSTSPTATLATASKVECVTSPYTLTGLTPNVLYYIAIVASNGYGDSANSTIVSATPTGTTTGGGGSATYDGSYSGTYSVTSPLGNATGSTGILTVTNGNLTDADGFFTGTVNATTGSFEGNWTYSDGSLPIPMKGVFSTTASFTLSGTISSTVSGTMTLHKL